MLSISIQPIIAEQRQTHFRVRVRMFVPIKKFTGITVFMGGKLFGRTATGGSIPPIVGGGCPTGWTEQPDGSCIEDVACPVGDEQRFHGDVGEPIPESVCSNGCWYEAKYDDLPVTFDMKGMAWSGNFVSTGNACAPGGGPGGPPDDPPLNCISDSYGNTFCAGVGPGNAPPNCMENAAGDQACIDAYDPLNCGYLNGDKVCYDDYPDQAECYFIPGGSYICFPGDEEPQSPPYPDTGTPGEPATPDITMEQGDGAGGPGKPIDYFNSDTVNQSSGEGGAPGPTSDKTPDETVKLEGPIKIDESGTPSAGSGIFDSNFQSIGLDQVESDIQAIGAGTSSPMPDMPTALTDVDQLIPPSGQCSDPQLLLMGHTMTIRFGEGAADFRDLLGWVLYVITALYLFYLVQGLPKKTR